MNGFYNQLKDKMINSNLRDLDKENEGYVSWHNPSTEVIEIQEMKKAIAEINEKFRMLELLLPGVFGEGIGTVDE